MKAFVIFPTICVFVLSLTLLKLLGEIKPKISLLRSTIVTVVFGGLMTWLSVEIFVFLYFANFLGAIVCIPCLTYLTPRLFRSNSNKKIFWISLVGLGIVSTAVTMGVAWFLILFSFLNNPMDPPTNKEGTEIKK
jgi:hypothetical protein